MNKLLAILLVVHLLLAFSQVNCEFEKNVYLETILNNENAFKWFNPGWDQYLSLFDLILNDQNRSISFECENSLRTIKRGLDAREEWALKCKTLTSQ